MKKIWLLFISFTGWVFTMGQQQTHPGYGAELSTISQRRTVPVLAGSSRPPSIAYNTSIDLRSELPPAEDQGDQGSCVAWALAYAIRSNLEFNKHHWSYYNGVTTQRDDNHVFSPTFVYNNYKTHFGTTHSPECSQGMTFYDAFTIIHNYGVPTLKDCKYDLNCNDAYNSDPDITHAFQNYDPYLDPVQLFDFRSDIKNNLYKHNPVFIIVKTDNNFDELYNERHPGVRYVWHPDPNRIHIDTNHAMVIAGWDNFTRQYLILNSWGADHYDKGYLYINETELPIVLLEAYAIPSYQIQPSATGSITPVDAGSVRVAGPNQLTTNLDNGKYVRLNNINAEVISVDNATKNYIIRFSDTNHNKTIDTIGFEKGDQKQFFYDSNLITFTYNDVPLNANNPSQFTFNIEKNGKSPQFENVIQDYKEEKKEIEYNINELQNKLELEKKPEVKTKIQNDITNQKSMKDMIERISPE